MEWYITVLSKYAVFTGRARRKEYWMFVLINAVVVFVLELSMWQWVLTFLLFQRFTLWPSFFLVLQ